LKYLGVLKIFIRASASRYCWD